MTRSDKLQPSPKYQLVTKTSSREMEGRGLTRLIGVATVITYFNIAYCVALIGPTLLDLIQQTSVTWERMGVLLMGRAACTVVGNILAGLLANSSLFSLLLVQAVAHVAVLVSQVFLPLCRNQTELITLFTIQGVFLGANNNLSNILTLVVQGKSAHAWMQGLFMAYSGAVLLAPIVSTPFLSEVAAKKQSTQSCNSTTNTTSTVGGAGSALSDLTDHVDLRIPYWTSLVPCAIAICLLLASAAWTWISGFKIPDMLDKGPARKIRPAVVILSFFLALLYFTLEGVTGRFLFSFAVKSKLCMSVKMAGMVTTLYGGATCIMRGLCAAAAAIRPSLASPVRLLTANHVALSVALIAILVGRDSLAPAVWIFAFFSGVGVSNGFPSLMALIKSQGASKKVAAVLPIGGGVGITLGPLITTYLMNDNVAGPGPGFYSLFCVVTHLATLLFGSLMSTIHNVATLPPDPALQRDVSVSYETREQGIIVNDNTEDPGGHEQCSDQKNGGGSEYSKSE